MTREEAKELLPIIQAYAEGKTIEVCNNHGVWVAMINPTPGFNCKPSSYRIKPELKYRPFKTKEECWNEMLKHQPFGWLKSKKKGRFHCIGEVSWAEAFGDVVTILSTSESFGNSSDTMLKEYTFADGTPFGIKEE